MVNYGTIYTLPFKSRKEVSYLIEIQKENYEGKSTELVGSGNSPFSVIIEDEDFLYTPNRFLLLQSVLLEVTICKICIRPDTNNTEYYVSEEMILFGLAS